MIETRQFDSYVDAFLEKHKNPYVIYTVDVVRISEAHEIVEWARENLKDDALVKLNRKDDDKFNTKWYIADEIDATAFKLRWMP